MTGLKYNSLYVLDFDYERDVAPLIPEGMEVDHDSTQVDFNHPTPVWYTWSAGGVMTSLFSSDGYAFNDNMLPEPEEGATFTANIVFVQQLG